MERKDNTLSMIIRQAWDGLSLNTMAKRVPATCREPHISIVGHITGYELQKRLHDTDRANGFGNRFLVVCVKRSNVLPDGGHFDEEGTTLIIGRLRAAVDTARTAGHVHWDDQARDLWWSVYPGLSRGRPGLLGMMTGRAEAQVTRLAVLYALADSCREITVEHLRAGLAVWRYCFDSARYLFGDRTGDVVADTIRGALQAAKTQGLTRTEISQIFRDIAAQRRRSELWDYWRATA